MLAQQDSILLLQTPKPAHQEVQLPKYYEETYFAKDTLLHPEISGGDFGVVGDPIPYVVRNDNLITGMLLACFILILVIFSKSREFLKRQYKTLIMPPHGLDEDLRETPGERRLKALMTLQTCLLFSILGYFMMKTFETGTFVIDDGYILIFMLFGMLIVYALLKVLLYTIVNCIFFDSKKNKQLLSSLLLIAATQGVLIFPVVLLLVYFGLSLQNVLYYCIIVVIIAKFLTFYKSLIIFFRQKGGFLRNILYFCALEIVPIAVLLGTGAIVADLLKVNF